MNYSLTPITDDNEYIEQNRKDWDTNASFWSYYIDRDEEHKAVLNDFADFVLEDDGPIQSILDIGCGEGYLLRKLAEDLKDAKLLGVDYSKRLLEFAKEKAAQMPNIEWMEVDITRQNIEQKFDVVTSTFCVDEIPDLYSFFEKVHGMLQKNGRFYLLWLEPANQNARYKIGHGIMNDMDLAKPIYFKSEESPANYHRVVRKDQFAILKSAEDSGFSLSGSVVSRCFPSHYCLQKLMKND